MIADIYKVHLNCNYDVTDDNSMDEVIWIIYDQSAGGCSFIWPWGSLDWSS
jgi:hypothetical protein